MSGVATKVRRAVGNFHYQKWVLFYRYHQKYGHTVTPVFHLSLAVMVFGLFNDSNGRGVVARSTAYNSRRDNYVDALEKFWAAEREQNDLNVDELEAAVYRSRTKAAADDLVLEDGRRWDQIFGAAPRFV